MAKKRGNGEGSIYSYKDGYAAQIVLGRDENTGKYIRPTFYGKTRKEVAEKLNAALAERDKGIIIKQTKHTLKDRIKYWLEQKKKISVSAGTWNKYETNSRIHILPELGDMPIKKITKVDIQKFITKKCESLAPATVKILHLILQQVLEDAVDDEVIGKNPANKIQLPQIKKRELTPLTEEEMAAILDVCQGTRLYPVVFVEYGTGLRRSEILGLTWDNIDAKNKTISINKAVVMVKSKPVLQLDTKNEASKAPIAVPPAIIDYLESLPHTSEYVFPQKDGNYQNPNRFRRDFKLKIKKLVKEGLLSSDELRFHDLRHNYASQLVALNIHQRLIQAQMRHADSRTTGQYSHTTMDAQHEVAATLNDTLLKVKK